MPRKKIIGVKEIDAKIVDLEKQIEDLKEQRKQVVLAEKSEKLLELDEIITNSGLTIAQVKAALKAQKPRKKTTRTKAKKETKSVTDAIIEDAE